MAHSYVEFDNHRQLMHDIENVCVVSVVLDVVGDGRTSLTESIRGLLESWRRLLDPYIAGCLDLQLDNFVRSDADQSCLRELLRNARDRLHSFGDIIPGEYLNRVVAAPAATPR